ncbi:MAG: hypothetical protein U9R54_09025, partial [Bacteroidota bacterium]|nr:hypothetical protein [Bacteroidota bacterium]
MRTIRSIFLGLSFALVLLISIIVILAYYNKDGLTNYIIDEVNKQLEVKVDVDEVNLRLFKKFPYASIELNNVVAFTNDYYNKRVLGYNTDTLFRANNLFLQFHLIDILTKKYRIKTVHFDKANINLFINKQSKVNYNFVKTSKDKSKDTSSYVLNINELKITNSKILYCNAAKNIVFDTKIDKTVLKGNFYKDKFDLKLSITNYINQLSIKSKIYLKNISTKFDCNINVDSNKYFVKSADLAINNCSFNISGVIVKNDETEIDLGVVTSDSKIKNFINIIPDTLIKKYAKNIIKGDIRISTTVKGSFSKNTMPSIISDISLSKGEYLLNNTKIKSIKFEGAYSNGAQNNSITSSIVIDDAYVEINKSNFSGELEIKNFDFPKLKINSKAKLYLNEIPDMFENDTIEQMDGTADIKFGYAGDIDKFELYNIFSPSFYCDVMIDNALLKIKNSKYKLENITGFTSINEDVYINDLYFEINESDFLLNGLASNM